MKRALPNAAACLLSLLFSTLLLAAETPVIEQDDPPGENTDAEPEAMIEEDEEEEQPAAPAAPAPGPTTGPAAVSPIDSLADPYSGFTPLAGKPVVTIVLASGQTVRGPLRFCLYGTGVAPLGGEPELVDSKGVTVQSGTDEFTVPWTDVKAVYENPKAARHGEDNCYLDSSYDPVRHYCDIHAEYLLDTKQGKKGLLVVDRYLYKWVVETGAKPTAVTGFLGDIKIDNASNPAAQEKELLAEVKRLAKSAIRRIDF